MADLPISYWGGGPDAYAMAMQGLQNGMAMADQRGQSVAAAQNAASGQAVNNQNIAASQQNQQQSAAQFGQQQHEYQRQQGFQAVMGVLAQKGANATTADYNAVLGQYPELTAQAQPLWASMSDQKQQSELKFGAQVYMALQTGSTDQALALLKERKAAALNSKDQQTADMTDGLIQAIQAHPEAALTSLRLFGDASTGGEFSKIIDTANNANRKIQRSVPLPDGTVENIYNNGDVEVVDAAGNVLTGADAAAAVATANAAGVDLAGDKSRAKATGTLGAQIANGADAAFEKARGAAIGTAAGTAQATLPGAQINASQIDEHINDLAADPYLSAMTGPVNSRLPNISADAARVQGKIDQLLGGAFLQAYQVLKGGGSITEVEGGKASAAMVIMSTTQNPADFLKALADFKQAVHDGVAKLDAQARMTPANVGAAATAPASAAVPGSTRDQAASGLKPGDIKQFTKADGTKANVRFKGGDPTVAANWEVVP